MKMFNNEKNHCFQKYTDRNSKKWIDICAKCSSWVDSDHKNKRSSEEEESWGHTYLCFSWISHISSWTSQAVLFLILCIVFTALPLYSKFSFCPALLPHILSLVPSKLKGLAENTSSYITNALSLELLLLSHFTFYILLWLLTSTYSASELLEGRNHMWHLVVNLRKSLASEGAQCN